MKRLFLFLLFISLILCASQGYTASFYVVGATATTGGGTGALDAIECEDIKGDNSATAITTGTMAIVVNSSKNLYIYRYNSAGTNSESDPYLIVPDDRADCSNAGQWELITSFTLGRTATPKTIYRDSDCTDTDDNVYWEMSCSDTGSNTEDCDIALYVQINGVATKVFEVDADGNIYFALDLNLASGKVLKINGTAMFPISGANPTTNTAGQIAVDTDDHFLEAYSDASRIMGNALKCETFTISEPDQQADDIVLKHFMADAYPHGVTIKDIAISTSASASDTHIIEEWDSRAGTTQTTIESITLTTSQYQEDDGTLSHSLIEADYFLVLNKDDATDDLAYMEITITYWINPGD